FQENRLVESARVFQNIKLVNPSLSKEEITALLASLELEDCYSKKAGNLSHALWDAAVFVWFPIM
ncbi:MAG: hypothetical protein IIV28_06765, partial [Alistipes sp.]|nr:hypothetical protein [Alistipes sp.]